MFEDAMDANDAGMLELTRRLETYADARLSPDAAATLRMRTNLMAAAHRRAALMAAETARATIAPVAAAPTEGRGRAASRPWRRPAAAFMAASLALAVMAGTVYGAKAGGPLYAARLWIEAANLPAGAVARAQAESSRLDARIAEAQQAAADGDAPGAEAALAAYSSIVVEAAAGVGGDQGARVTIEVSVSRHVVVLTQLAGTVPEHARGAVQKALSSSSAVIQEMDGANPQSSDDKPTNTNASGNGLLPGAMPSGAPIPPDGPPPAAGGGVTVTPSTPDTPEKVQRSRDHAVPPPGQSRGGGPKKTDRPAHPTPAPGGPRDAAPAGTRSGEPPAP